MIRGTATVSYADKPDEVLQIVPFDWMRFERYCQAHKLAADPTAAPATWGMYLAYSAYDRAHAGNGALPGFDAWAQTVQSIDLDVAAPDPTPPEVSDG